MFILISLLGVILALVLVHLNGKYNEMYWKRRGVTFHQRNKVMGPLWDFVTQDRALFEILGDLHKQYPNEPAVGIGSFLTPSLYVKDHQNIQHILQGDFQSFNHRAIEATKDDLLADNILVMHGNRWKLMRQNMTPLFTATKLKNMYYILDKSAQDFVEFLQENPAKMKGFDTYDTMNTFCSAALSAGVFGITTKSIFDSPFLKMAREAVATNTINNLKFAVANTSISVFKALGLTIFKKHEKFFIGAIKQVIRQREKEDIKKHDFADIAVSLQKNGVMRDQETGLELEPTDELLAAQAFFFYIAGVEPTAAAMYATFIELGRHPEMLQKVHKEINDAFEKHGQLTYDAVNEMEYLDKVLSEALRMYPPVGFLTRQCVRKTVLPVGNIKIDKGTRVFTPIFDLHHDPKIYPNPEVFDPERFAQDSKAGDIGYQPFGKGGRICIGMRYGRLQAKAGIIHLLRNFTVKSSVEGKIKYNKQSFQVRPSNVNIEFISLKKNG